MDNLNKAEVLAEQLRQEPYVLFSNDWVSKSFRLKRRCKELGIDARVVVCIGISKAKWFGFWLTIPVIHGWGEVEGKRIETSRPLGSSGIWSISYCRRFNSRYQYAPIDQPTEVIQKGTFRGLKENSVEYHTPLLKSCCLLH